MNRRTTSEIIFFIIMFLLFFLTMKLNEFWIKKGGNLHPNLSYMITGLLFTLLMLAIWYLAKLNGSSSEGFWDISAGAKCKGGPYMWQGDSETAMMCKEMASTPEGRCEISSYNCPTGYTGTPKAPFVYSPLSNDEWQNERCENRPTCPCKDVGLCGMEKQVE